MTKRHGPVTARISGPDELLQAVPYLLGFHPSQSLVLIGLAQDRLVVTARIDLADLAEPGTLGQIVSALARGGADTLVGVVYERAAPAQPLPWRGLVAELADECLANRCEFGDLLRVDDGRWWSYLCDSPGCCPPEGRALDRAPSSFVAEATYAGVVALPDRETLAGTLRPGPPAELGAVRSLLERERTARDAQQDPVRAERSVKRAVFAAARRADAAEADGDGIGDWLGDREVARFGLALASTAVRDPVWVAVDHGRLDGRALWRALGRRLPGRFAATPLFLYGWASWRAGNGALAGVAAERAIECDPGYGAADMLLAVLAHGVSPHQFPKLRAPRAA